MSAKPPSVTDYRIARPHAMRRAGGRRLMRTNDLPMNVPRVTVITIVRNGKSTLEKAIRSVAAQTYQNIEYIVVDGCSTDGTVELLERLSSQIDYWISEPDRGTSDAANKAISYATGEFITWVCADDWLPSHHVASGVEVLLRTGADFVFGDVTYFDGDAPIFVQLGDPYYARTVRYRMPHVNSPTWIMRKARFDEIGVFDLKYNVASDYEWLLRLHLAGGKGVYDRRLTANHRIGGISTVAVFRGYRECYAAARAHGAPPTVAYAVFLWLCIRRKTRDWTAKVLPPSLYRYVLARVRKSYERPSVR